MPVLVRNQEAGPAVFSDPTNNVAVEWGGKGDPTGSDVQYVPDSLQQNAAFMRAIQRGIFAIVEESEGADVLERQSASFEQGKAASAAAAADSITREANNDLVEVKCIGPANRGQGECGHPVPVRDKDQGKAPALCPRHSSLVGEFVQVETGDMKDTGDSLVPVQKWVRTQVTPRERQKQ